MPHAVSLENITKSLGGKLVVDRVSFDVAEGEFFSMLGPSGCGKTTTLRMLAGFEDADSGEMRIGGADMRGVPPYRRACNLVFQEYALFPHLTVGENVAFGLEMARTPPAEIAVRVRESLALVRLEEYAGRRPHELSGGQRQRAAVARAIARRPPLLLLDEPLGALDQQLRRDMQIELKQLQRRLGTTFVYVTHDQEEALTMSDRIAVMRNGRVAQLGAPEALYDRPADAFVAKFLGEANAIEAVVVGRDGVGQSGGTRVACGGGAVALSSSDAGGAAGAKVTAIVRPEHVVVVADAAGPLVVEESAFAGSSVRHSLRGATDATRGLAIVARRPADESPRPAVGARVGVRVAPDAVRIVARSEE